MKKLKYISIYSLFLLTIFIVKAEPTALHKPMKIICYNILRGMERDTTADKSLFTNWLKLHDPDIVAIQEAAKCKQKDLEELAHKYGHPYAILLKENNYCAAITSKYPITDVYRVIDNMHHGFIKAKINGYNVIVLHLCPFTYTKRREEINIVLQTIAASKQKENWIVMGDFNSISPLDSMIYKNGKYLANVKKLAKKYSYHDNLIDGEKLDFEVHKKILDFGLLDALRIYNKNLIIPRSSRIDFIYLSRNLKNKVSYSEIIKDDFTKKYSDHLPLILKLK